MFGERNGAVSREQMRERIGRYANAPIEEMTHEVGCTIIREPFA